MKLNTNDDSKCEFLSQFEKRSLIYPQAETLLSWGWDLNPRNRNGIF